MPEHVEHPERDGERTNERPRRARRKSEGLADLTLEEITAAYKDKYKPIITLEEAAEISRLSPNTIKHRMSRHGHFSRSAKRGKPLRFWRDRFVQEVMS